MSYISLFALIIAIIIVTTRFILNFMEEKDRAAGKIIINPEEYKMSGLLKILFRERKEKIKNFLKRKNA